jgi:ribosomal protein L34E
MNAYNTRQSQKEENTMPRPKGSKNKKNRTPAENLDALIAQKQEEKAALEAQRDEIAAVVEAQKNELKAVKAELKKVDKALTGLEAEKAANEAAVAAAAAKEAVQSRIDALLSEGKTLDEIMEMLG